MKNMKKLMALTMAAAMTLSVSAVAFAEEAAATEAATEAAAEGESEEVVENSSGIYTVDDLEGKTIGVQLGTTGDTFATELETAGTATVER